MMEQARSAPCLEVPSIPEDLRAKREARRLWALRRLQPLILGLVLRQVRTTCRSAVFDTGAVFGVACFRRGTLPR